MIKRVTKEAKAKIMELFPKATIAEDMPNGMNRHQQFDILDVKVKNGVLTFVVDADKEIYEDVDVPLHFMKEAHMIERFIKKGFKRAHWKA